MPRGHRLTDDQCAEVARLFKEGKTHGEAIRITGISPTTIGKHYRRLREKSAPTPTTGAEQCPADTR